MEFYTHQDNARKQTLWLMVLFGLGVLGITLVTYLLLAFIEAMAVYGDNFETHHLWNPTILVFSFFITAAIVGLSALYKISKLKAGGGAYVAEELGGREISSDTKNSKEKQLLNIVEEIAIATGIRRPKVFLLDKEEGINAFAAGFSPKSAVIGVTKGCLDKLSREELQGVIAHEFSHILNGDMRMNIRLMGLLFGILVLSILGYYILRSSFYFRGTNSKTKGPGAMLVVLLGTGLIAIGSVGSFFGQFIKAAINRQREFLADASAVEYTRSQDTIGKALIKIRDDAYGSRIFSPAAPDASHFFFAEGVLSGFASFFATHPPIEERISRIYSGKVKYPKETEGKKVVPAAPKTLGTYIEMAGQPDLEQIGVAKQLIEKLDPNIRRAVTDPIGAASIIYLLLVSKDEAHRNEQLQLIQKEAPYSVNVEMKNLLPLFDQIDVRARLPLIDMAISSLTQLTPKQSQGFMEIVNRLIYSDERKNLFEWVMEKILLKHVRDHLHSTSETCGIASIENLQADAARLMHVVAKVGHRSEKEEQAAFVEGMKALSIKGKAYTVGKVHLGQLEESIHRLADLRTEEKKKLLHALSICIQHDKRITSAEAELFRGIADAIDYPIPLVVGT